MSGTTLALLLATAFYLGVTLGFVACSLLSSTRIAEAERRQWLPDDVSATAVPQKKTGQ